MLTDDSTAATHDPNEACEQFCTRPIGPEGTPKTEDFLACCPECDRLVDWLADDVLPAIHRDGYWTPPDADVDDELHAMIAQEGFQKFLLEFLKPIEAACRVVYLPEGEGPS